ncbi:hypothetical protein [Mycolicibacterium sp. P1-18]|uniref:hypothetical protein n=1 Tax=Mycolicibacterium sp. P1-18 TaxID=2024615 RepID=UPI0011F3C9B3|nr:hypothetical protein [Mycolicibacterium sp. P1-18]
MDSGTKRNLATYYANFLIVGVTGFIVNPLLLGALGPLLFGVWKSLQRYLDFATVADGRASQALKWIVASRTALSTEERQRDIAAAVHVWFRWLPVAFVVAGAITVGMPLLIDDIPVDLKAMVYSAAAILALNTILTGLLAIPDSVLMGVNQGYKSMIVTTAAYILSNATMVLAAISGWPIWTLAAIVLIAAAFNSLFTLAIARRSITWWGLSKPTTEDIRRVFGYSTWTLGWVAVDKLLLCSELIVISVMIGAITVTEYALTTYVMQFVLSIALVTASGFMPLLGSHLGAADMCAAAERARSVRHLVVGVTAVGGGAVLAFNEVFVNWWVGSDQYMGTLMNALLVVLGLQFALIRMDGQILDVTMRIAPKVLIGLASSAGGVLAACCVYAYSGNLPAAMSALIMARLISNIAFPVLVARSVPGSALPFLPLFLSVAFLIGSFIVGPRIATEALPMRIGLSCAWLAAALAAAWFGLVPRHIVRALLTRSTAS